MFPSPAILSPSYRAVSHPVELQSLTVDDFLRILTEPKASLTKQYSRA